METLEKNQNLIVAIIIITFALIAHFALAQSLNEGHKHPTVFPTSVRTGECYDSETSSNYLIFGLDKTIKVLIPENSSSSSIEIFNFLGQRIWKQNGKIGLNDIPVRITGYYLIQLSNTKYSLSKKVFIK